LTARKSGEWIEVEFPREKIAAIESPRDALEALGVGAVAAASSDRLSYLVLELESEAAVRGVSPDFGLLKKVPFEGVIVTSRAEAGSRYAIVSRFFAPRKGVNEDPATGSAHCRLGPYWTEKLGQTDFDAYQASARGADIRVVVGRDRVTLGGQAVTVLQGELV
jgi:PhzF family phenazine biosynthesis protein